MDKLSLKKVIASMEASPAGLLDAATTRMECLHSFILSFQPIKASIAANTCCVVQKMQGCVCVCACVMSLSLSLSHSAPSPWIGLTFVTIFTIFTHV